jgi:hypothetical protein
MPLPDIPLRVSTYYYCSQASWEIGSIAPADDKAAFIKAMSVGASTNHQCLSFIY